MIEMTRKVIPCYELKPCGCDCGKLIPVRDTRGREINFLKGHQNSKGRKYTDPYGYVHVYSPNHPLVNPSKPYMQEHRLVWEEYHKAILLDWGVVHHINRIRNDNRIENLQGMTNSEHAILHHTKDISNRKCAHCELGIKSIKRRVNNPTIKWTRNPEDKNQWLCRAHYEKLRWIK